MDTRTRQALKKDSFVQATATSVSWVGDHRSGVVRWAIERQPYLLYGNKAPKAAKKPSVIAETGPMP